MAGSEKVMARPFDILGIAREGSDGHDVRKAYRRLALLIHPDKNPGLEELSRARGLKSHALGSQSLGALVAVAGRGVKSHALGSQSLGGLLLLRLLLRLALLVFDFYQTIFVTPAQCQEALIRLQQGREAAEAEMQQSDAAGEKSGRGGETRCDATTAAANAGVDSAFKCKYPGCDLAPCKQCANGCCTRNITHCHMIARGKDGQQCFFHPPPRVRLYHFEAPLGAAEVMKGLEPAVGPDEPAAGPELMASGPAPDSCGAPGAAAGGEAAVVSFAARLKEPRGGGAGPLQGQPQAFEAMAALCAARAGLKSAIEPQSRGKRRNNRHFMFKSCLAPDTSARGPPQDILRQVLARPALKQQLALVLGQLLSCVLVPSLIVPQPAFVSSSHLLDVSLPNSYVFDNRALAPLYFFAGKSPKTQRRELQVGAHANAPSQPRWGHVAAQRMGIDKAVINDEFQRLSFATVCLAPAETPKTNEDVWLGDKCPERNGLLAVKELYKKPIQPRGSTVLSKQDRLIYIPLKLLGTSTIFDPDTEDDLRDLAFDLEQTSEKIPKAAAKLDFGETRTLRRRRGPAAPRVAEPAVNAEIGAPKGSDFYLELLPADSRTLEEDNYWIRRRQKWIVKKKVDAVAKGNKTARFYAKSMFGEETLSVGTCVVIAPATSTGRIRASFRRVLIDSSRGSGYRGRLLLPGSCYLLSTCDCICGMGYYNQQFVIISCSANSDFALVEHVQPVAVSKRVDSHLSVCGSSTLCL
ncbi:unnamed protein product [Prorocentrum cordatum]|uniref:J domain-containing protein n=1 Tax=Prorocentrum cordatum TaxID=2364126 RepID=A0ABN9TZQ2_9DINO|nr:unnamed protein product [Polarella glacialis]